MIGAADASGAVGVGNGRRRCGIRVDGGGNGDAGAARPGVGLANTRARLARLYGAGGTLEVSDAAGGGVEVRVRLPYRPAPGGEVVTR